MSRTGTTGMALLLLGTARSPGRTVQPGQEDSYGARPLLLHDGHLGPPGPYGARQAGVTPLPREDSPDYSRTSELYRSAYIRVRTSSMSSSTLAAFSSLPCSACISAALTFRSVSSVPMGET